MRTKLLFAAIGLLGLLVLETAFSQDGSNSLAERRRFLYGLNVELKAEPRSDSATLRRLPFGMRVLVHAEPVGGRRSADGRWCEIEMSVSGFVPCQFLSTGRPEITQVNMVEQASEFANKPSVSSLLVVATSLASARSGTGETSMPVPKVEAYEKMKASLLAGYLPQATGATALHQVNQTQHSWQQYRAAALAVPPECLTSARPYLPDLCKAYLAFETMGFPALGVNDAIKVLKASRVPKLPPSGASPIRFDAQLAVATEAEDIGQALRIPVVTSFTPRRMTRGATTSLPEQWSSGVWDLHQVTSQSSRPVYRHTLFAHGAIRSERTVQRSAYQVPDPDTAHNCDGFVPGFRFGKPESANVKLELGGKSDLAKTIAERRKGPTSLVQFFTIDPRKFVNAHPKVTYIGTPVKAGVEPESQAVQAIQQMDFDLNGDGVADFVVIKLIGLLTDEVGTMNKSEPHTHLFLANLAGQWRIVGVDRYAYGCTC